MMDFLGLKEKNMEFFFVKCVWVSIVFTFFLKEKVDTVFFRKKSFEMKKMTNMKKKQQFSGCIPDVCKPVTVQC